MFICHLLQLNFSAHVHGAICSAFTLISGVTVLNARSGPADAQQKAVALVDSALQLGNRESLLAYLFGSKENAGNSPIAKSFQPQVAAGALPSLRSIAESHSSLLKSSCSSQVRDLRCKIGLNPSNLRVAAPSGSLLDHCN